MQVFKLIEKCFVDYVRNENLNYSPHYHLHPKEKKNGNEIYKTAVKLHPIIVPYSLFL